MKIYLTCCLMVMLFTLASPGTRISLEQFPMEAQPSVECLKVSPNGNIYFADRSNYKIYYYSPAGKFLTSVGRQGQGPGDFQRWFGVFDAAENGDIFQVDFFGGNRRITHFTAAGRLLDSVPIQTPGNNGAEAIISLKDGNLALAILKSPIIEKKNPFLILHINVEFAIVNTRGKTLRVLANEKYPASFSDTNDSGWPNFPYAPNFLSTYCPHTHTLISLVTNSPHLKKYNLTQQTITEIPHHIPLVKLTQDDINTWVAPIRERKDIYTMHQHIYKMLLKEWQTIVNVKPTIERIFFNPEGEFFMVLEKKEKSEVRKFSSHFKPLGSKEMTAVPAAIDKTRLYYLKYDEENDHNYIEIENRNGFF